VKDSPSFVHSHHIIVNTTFDFSSCSMTVLNQLDCFGSHCTCIINKYGIRRWIESNTVNFHGVGMEIFGREEHQDSFQLALY
jgi:hypothetical protein